MRATSIRRLLQFLGVPAMLLVVATSLAEAEPPQGSPQPPPKPERGAPAWLACAAAVDPTVREALAQASALLSQIWLETDHGRYAAYTFPGEKRNPFDLSQATPPAGPRDGIVQAKPPDCTWRRATDADPVEVRFTTPFYRFHEAGAGWSPPLRDGLMLAALVAPSAPGTWLARDQQLPQAILLPEQNARRPGDAEIPREARWAEPMPGCGKRERWTGEACVKRKR